MTRTACTACGGDLTSFLDLGSSPLADKFPENLAVTERWYPLEVAVCQGCWLVQLLEVVPDDELYGEDYGFRTSASPAAVRYFAGLAASLLSGFGHLAKRLTVEIACNDGTLLRHFADAGCNVLGFEPSGAWKDVTGMAVIPKPFSSSVAMASEKIGAAGLVIACNVIAHVEDPHDFLNGVRGLLAKDGIAIIEFQDVAALIAGCQYDHVYHEHRQFFSLASFSRLAGFCGLQVVDWERTPAQGGSMRVTLKRGNKNVTGVMGEPWLETMTPYEGMQARAEYSRKRLNALIGAELNETRVIAGYGASAKSCTLFNFCGLGPQEIRWVEDLTPGKIGRLTPGSKISVRSPTAPVPGSQTPYCGTRPATYLLSSWNYAGSMLRQEREFLDGGGRIIIPGAVPVII